MIQPDHSFEDWLKTKLHNPKFRKAFEDYELPSRLAAEVSLLRRKKGLTQHELARRIKTSQEVISRLENAARPSLTLRTLQRLATALDKRLEIRFL